MASILPSLSRLIRPRPNGLSTVSVNIDIPSVLADFKAVNVWQLTNGTSPYKIRLWPSFGNSDRVTFTAWPVPNCSVWATHVIGKCAYCSLMSAWTCSPPKPWTIMVSSTVNWWQVSSTWPNNDLPASVCSTFGLADCIRVPLPAARIITERGAVIVFLKKSLQM